MFTGIVQGVGKVYSVDIKEGIKTICIQLPISMIDNLKVGASIANNGCCLTITKYENNLVWFDLVAETLKLTNLNKVEKGNYINLERAAKFGDEIGGHLMSGHIISTVTIENIIDNDGNKTIWFGFQEEFSKYILTKGFVGLDGCSLTIGEVKTNQFNVHLIPETIQKTIFNLRKIGDLVNLEIDPQTQAIVDTVTRIMKNQ